MPDRLGGGFSVAQSQTDVPISRNIQFFGDNSVGNVQIIFDREVLLEPWYGCSDGTTTGYMKIPTEMVIRRLLPAAKHSVTVIQV